MPHNPSFEVSELHQESLVSSVLGSVDSLTLRVMGAESIQASSSWFTKCRNKWAFVHLHSPQFAEIHRRC
jgi:hypothetical protein